MMSSPISPSSAQRAWRLVRRRMYRFAVRPAADFEFVEGTPHAFARSGGAPQLALVGLQRRLPRGWCHVQCSLSVGVNAPAELQLLCDMGQGFEFAHVVPLPPIVGPTDCIDAEVHIPAGCRGLRLAIEGEQIKTVRLRGVHLREISKYEALLRGAWRQGTRRPLSVNRLKRVARRVATAASAGGLSEVIHLVQRSGHNAERTYALWVRQFDTLTDADKDGATARVQAMVAPPRISVIMPVYNVDDVYLRRAIDSVLGQWYPHWELCIADDCSPLPHVAATLTEYAARDPRIKIVLRPANGHISEASNSALAQATGDFVALFDHDDELAAHALYLVAEEIVAHPDVGLIYSDEDKIDENGTRRDPYFKPDWNPDLLQSQNFVSHLGVYRRALVQKLGGFRQGYEGSQDYDLVLRVTEQLTDAQIRHIPHVLYHWRAISGSTALGSSAKPYAYVAAEKALNDRVRRLGWDAHVETAEALGLYRMTFALPSPQPRVCIIIPSRDRADLLRRCVASILDKTDYANFELLLVDNDSQEPATHKLFDKLAQDSNIRVLRDPRPFNYAALNNAAASATDAPLLAFLNNDLEVLDGSWLTEMVRQALRPKVGAVGAKLYYANRTIQHAGVLLGIGGIASHAHKHVPADSPGYFGRASLVQNFSAVTAACMVVRRDSFVAVGGFDEALAVAYNDLDLCLRLRERGLHNVYTPYAQLLHHESASRGADTRPQHQARFAQETATIRQRWGDLIARDPAYNPNLTFDREDYTPAFPPRSPRIWRASEASE